MPRKYAPIVYSKSDIKALSEMAANSDDQRLATRALIVLKCIEGKQIKDIAAELGERPNTVILWKNRFSEKGIDGLSNMPRGVYVGKYLDNKAQIIAKIKTPPPEGAKRWTGKALSAELGVPPDVIWRFLRKEHIILKDVPDETDRESCDDDSQDVYDVSLKFSARKDDIMKNENTNDKSKSDNMDLIITARAVGKDGTVIEREIRLDGALPNLNDFDLSTYDGFRRDFNQAEQSIIAGRNQVSDEIIQAYIEAAAKKNKSRKKQ